MKQTAVEWLAEELDEYLELYPSDWKFIAKVIEQAKEMEKEQIVKSALRGYLVGEDNISLEDAKLYGEEYYDMTFKTK